MVGGPSRIGQYANGNTRRGQTPEVIHRGTIGYEIGGLYDQGLRGSGIGILGKHGKGRVRIFAAPIGTVDNDPGPGPEQFSSELLQPGLGRHPGLLVVFAARAHTLTGNCQLLQLCLAGRLTFLAVHRRDRYRQVGIPKQIERSPCLASDLTQGNGIHILEVEAGVIAEVLVANIPASHDGGDPIHQENLVVHAVIQGGLVESVIAGFRGTPIAHGVKQTDLHIGVCVQSLIGRIPTRVINIIQQNAHAHATVRSRQHLMG